MSKAVKVIVIFLVIDAALVAGYLLYKGLAAGKSKNPLEVYEWVTIDESYIPKNYVEEFIKSDSLQKGLFPVHLKNYGKDASALRKFRGSNFAAPTEAQLNMMYRGLEDWMLIDLKYKNEKGMEVLRTVLYVMVKGEWKVGDSGRLFK